MPTWGTDDRQQALVTGPARSYENTRFERHEDVPLSNCFFTDPPSRWFWKMRVAQGTFAKFYLVNGADLTGESNNPVVVPNSEGAFFGKTGQEAKRTVKIYGLQPGTTLIGFKSPWSRETVVTMQVEVFSLPGDKPSRVKLLAKAGLIVGPNVPNPYSLAWMIYRPGGPPETLFDGILPGDTKHIVINAHGQMNATNGSVTTDGITVLVAGNLWRGNCRDVFQKLGAAWAGGVIWFVACEVGADLEFCRTVAVASKAFVVAPSITCPIIARVPPGTIDWFGESMPKVFKKDDGTPIAVPAFLAQQETLQFQIIPG